jgi:hypothetical protein
MGGELLNYSGCGISPIPFCVAGNACAAAKEKNNEVLNEAQSPQFWAHSRSGPLGSTSRFVNVPDKAAGVNFVP